uniref:Uncharacterized protein n=1 Tax=Zea mays TaxID=4577 RepID=B6U536_MAIZE|nr:hypothetical protein [Zea mays]
MKTTSSGIAVVLLVAMLAVHSALAEHDRSGVCKISRSLDRLRLLKLVSSPHLPESLVV